MFLPRALSAVTDAQNAVGRLSPVYAADVMEYKDNIDETADVAVRVENATFEWVVGAEAENIKKDRKDKAAEKGIDEVEPQLAAPFQIPNISIVIPRGQLVAIVGPVRQTHSWPIVAKLTNIFAGRVRKELPTSRRKCGQAETLYIH